MKSIKMTIKPNGELVLPEAHFSTLQGLFYELLSFDPVLSDEVHGMRSGKTDAIKQFCFSDLHYPCGSSRGSAFYKSSFTFEVRSANDPIIETIERSVNDDPLIVINGHECEIINYRVSSTVFLSNSFDMRMDSPITVYRSNKRRDYYSQSDPEFYEIVKNNLLKKYLLAYGEAYAGEFSFSCLDKERCGMVEVPYGKGSIKACRGNYRLEASPKMLAAAYYCGIGGKNSLGFGFPEIAHAEKENEKE